MAVKVTPGFPPISLDVVPGLNTLLKNILGMVLRDKIVFPAAVAIPIADLLGVFDNVPGYRSRGDEQGGEQAKSATSNTATGSIPTKPNVVVNNPTDKNDDVLPTDSSAEAEAVEYISKSVIKVGEQKS